MPAEFGGAELTILEHAIVSEEVGSDPRDGARLDAHRDFTLAVPTPDHFIPLLYLAGLAEGSTSGGDPELLIDGYTYGSLSTTAYTLGLDARRTGRVEWPRVVMSLR